MFSVNKPNSPLGSSFEEPVFQNQRNIRNIENNYFNDEYQKSIQGKMDRMEIQKNRKKQELQLYNRKNEDYLNSVAMNRYHKQQEKNFMAEQYDQMINRRKTKELQSKQQEINFQKELLSQPTWVRDASQQREENKKKIELYGKQLQRHVKAQEMRVSHEFQIERGMRDRINQQAKQILDKQYQELQERQKRKNQFELRQNQLLGVNTKNPELQTNRSSLSGSRLLEQMNMRKKQQEIYGKGLESQVHLNQQRRRKQIEHHFNPGQSYNPITNPIPVVYKNPNVLRMLAQK